MFDNYKKLGFFNPWFFSSNGKNIISDNFDGIMNSFIQPKELDVTAVIEVLNKNYCLADRTLFKGMRRTPWMAKPNTDCTGWVYAKVPNHEEKIINENSISKEFFRLLQNEIVTAIGKHKNIGILLTGGMDSRMIAGTLDFLIRTGKIENVKVRAMTWGNDNSRDIVYAKEIANRLGWDWKQFKVTASDMLENIEITAKNGCEYSPIHLHAMPQVSNEKGLDCILAGSYGDSIGRGEYSGRKVRDLRPLDHSLSNVLNILITKQFKKNISNCSEDLRSYHELFPQEKKYQQFEQDQQLHYMRRMLNPCMAVINEKIPVHQMFSAPEVFGYMWSLDPLLRTNKVYSDIMSFFKTDLSDIPWARTGYPYLSDNIKPDGYDKQHHNYSHIVNYEIDREIKQLVMSENIKELGIFNMFSLRNILCINKTVGKIDDSVFVEEKLLWIAALSKLVASNSIDCSANSHSSFVDKFNGIIRTPTILLFRPFYGFIKSKIKIIKFIFKK